MKLTCIGEILWDVFDHAEHLGGAVFNLAAHAAQMGHDVCFISAVGDDERGRRALLQAGELGVRTDYIKTVAGQPTGYVTVSLDDGGQPTYVIHRPVAYDFASLSDGELTAISDSEPHWICYGTLHQITGGARELTRRLVDAIPGARTFYDVNLRKDSYTPELVDSLLRMANVVKLNDAEVEALGVMLDLPHASIEEFCRRNAGAFGWEAVCVTRGAAGCSLLLDGGFVESPGQPVKVADAVGAGDAFAAAFLHGLGEGWPAERIAAFANRVGGFVASQSGAVPRWSPAGFQ